MQYFKVELFYDDAMDYGFVEACEDVLHAIYHCIISYENMDIIPVAMETKKLLLFIRYSGNADCDQVLHLLKEALVHEVLGYPGDDDIDEPAIIGDYIKTTLLVEVSWEYCRDVLTEKHRNGSEYFNAAALCKFLQKSQERFQVIAVQKSFPKNGMVRVHCCLVKDSRIYLYTRNKDLILLGEYRDAIEDICHAVREDKYDWADFTIRDNDTVQMEQGCVYVNENEQPCFKAQSSMKRQPFSDKSLRLFNQFLRIVNKDNNEMVEALKISLKMGFFRKEVEEIIKGDKPRELDAIDKELIVRAKNEGVAYIKRYVKTIMATDKPDRFLTINSFFRRLFNLETYEYITLQEIMEGDPC